MSLYDTADQARREAKKAKAKEPKPDPLRDYLVLIADHIEDETNTAANGQPAVTFTLSMWNGAWIAALNDKEGKRSCSGWGRTMTAALEELEEKIGNPGPKTWTPWKVQVTPIPKKPVK